MQKTFILVFLLTVLYCPLFAQNASLSGSIETPTGAPISNVEVNLFDNNGTLIGSQTASNGQYTFTGLVQGNSYELEFIKSNDPLNGVSTFDMVLQARHILGIALLDTNEKMVAGDVNLSGTNTTLDLVFMRRLILNIDQSFPVLPSWRFVAADLDLSQPGIPTNNRVSLSLGSSAVVQDITGIKLGDLNNSVFP